MARSWTRLHEHLGAAAGPPSFDMVRQAAADNLAESDDLDWKEMLPQPPRCHGVDVSRMQRTKSSRPLRISTLPGSPG